MKLLYVANMRVPTEKAHGAQIFKTCEALAALGVAVELAVTNRHTPISEDPFEYYGVEKRFSLTRLAVPDVVSRGKVGFWAESLVFGLRARALARRNVPDVIYGRDELALVFTPGAVVWEAHRGAWSLAARIVARRARRIVVISQGLKDFYISKGIPRERIVVAHDGIDLDLFARSTSKEAARQRLGLPTEGQLAMYVGRLDGWKGVDTLLSAADSLPVGLVVVGGEPAQVEVYRARYPSVHFPGFRPYRELADNLAAADVLVLPNTGKDEISAHFTSPLKLFAYMAAGKPIVASDLPSIREVIDDESAYFFEADNPASLASAVRRAIGDPEAPRRAARAKELVSDYSWTLRAQRIRNAIQV